jgi:hypothetical protein
VQPLSQTSPSHPPTTPIIKVTRIPDGIHPSRPKRGQDFLKVMGMQDRNPSLTPHIDGHDMSNRQHVERRLMYALTSQYQWALGIARVRN